MPNDRMDVLLAGPVKPGTADKVGKDFIVIIDKSGKVTYKFNPTLCGEIENFLIESLKTAKRIYKNDYGVKWQSNGDVSISLNNPVREAREYLLGATQQSNNVGATFLRELLKDKEGLSFAFLLDLKNFIEGETTAKRVAIQYIIYAQNEKPDLYEKYDKMFPRKTASANDGLEKVKAEETKDKGKSTDNRVGLKETVVRIINRVFKPADVQVSNRDTKAARAAGTPVMGSKEMSPVRKTINLMVAIRNATKEVEKEKRGAVIERLLISELGNENSELISALKSRIVENYGQLDKKVTEKSFLGRIKTLLDTHQIDILARGVKSKPMDLKSIETRIRDIRL